MQEQMTLTPPKICAQKKHKVMFTIACILLAVGLLVQLGTIIATEAYLQDVNEDYNNADHSDDALPGLGAFIMGLGSILIMLAGIMVSFALRDIAWGAGLVLSGILTFRKNQIPKPMWVISLIMFIFYACFVISDLLALIAGFAMSLGFKLFA